MKKRKKRKRSASVAARRHVAEILAEILATQAWLCCQMDMVRSAICGPNPAVPDDNGEPRPPGNWMTVKQAMFFAQRSNTAILKWVKSGRVRHCQPAGPKTTVWIEEASLRARCESLRIHTLDTPPVDPSSSSA
jgi:hypothetical protein